MSKTPIRKVRDGQKIPSLPENLTPLHVSQVKRPRPSPAGPKSRGK